MEGVRYCRNRRSAAPRRFPVDGGDCREMVSGYAELTLARAGRFRRSQSDRDVSARSGGGIQERKVSATLGGSVPWFASASFVLADRGAGDADDIGNGLLG